MKATKILGIVVVGVIVFGVIKTVAQAGDFVITPPHAVPASINELLGKVTVVPARPNPAGYDRDCSPGHGCVFGPAWTDSHAGFGGRNGCDTRNDILAAQLRDISVKPRTQNCVVLTGQLKDPYTGQQIAFRRSNPLAIQIDHVYPLALAWDMGASKWSLQRRIDFANDEIRNLLAVSGRANQSKSDKSPAEWLVPDNPAYRCTYMVRYLQVAAAYNLPITKADSITIRRAAANCG